MIIVNDIESLWLWWDERNKEAKFILLDQIWDTVQEICTVYCNNKHVLETSSGNDRISTHIHQANQTSNIDDVNTHMNEFYCKRVVSLSFTPNLY